MRAPTSSDGNAAGKTTRTATPDGCRPRMRATSDQLTIDAVNARDQIHVDREERPMAMSRVILADSPMPSQSSNNGTHASDGTARIAWRVGSIARSTVRFKPTSVPSTISERERDGKSSEDPCRAREDVLLQQPTLPKRAEFGQHARGRGELVRSKPVGAPGDDPQK